MRSKIILPDAEILRTYDQLRDFGNAFFNAEFYFLLMVGRQGLAKSWEFQSRCAPTKDRHGNEISLAYYVKGNVTPVEAYRLAYEHRNKLLIFDDSERLWADSNGRYLLRDLTECTPWKTVHWRTANKDLERAGIPQSFRTCSKVCLIMNRFAFGDAFEYDAIIDRAQFLYFDPAPLEVHKNTALWYWDQETYDFIAEHLHLIDPHKLSSRTYVKAYERKPKGDWKDFIACRYFTQSSEKWVIALENDLSYPSVEERVAEFIRRTGAGRSTYFNLKKALKADGQLQRTDVPRYVLTARAPDVPDLEAEARAAADENRRRAGEQRRQQDEEQEYRDLEDQYFPDEDEDDSDDEE